MGHFSLIRHRESYETARYFCAERPGRPGRFLVMWMKHTLYATGVWIAACSAAAAQAPPAGKPPAEIASPAAAAGSRDCAPMQSAPRQDSIAPEGGTTGQKAKEPLGDKLAKIRRRALSPLRGWIPRSVFRDARYRQYAGDLPPPGSPGGDPTVRPNCARPPRAGQRTIGFA